MGEADRRFPRASARGDEGTKPPSYTRADLLVAILLAALVAAWLIIYGAILIKHGVPHGH
jgi:hypothetical protein